MLIIPAGIIGAPAYAQTGGERYFPDTGHYISGEYLEFYNSIDSPEIIYGSPITEPFYQESPGLNVQFFENARFEYHPENPAGQRIVLTDLGEYTHAQGSPVQLDTYAGGCKVFSNDVNHRYPVCYSFLEFYEKHGGVNQFGLPISGMEMQSGFIMQYFERARLEWHPELPQGKKVVIGELGKIYFDLLHLSPRLLDPVENNIIKEPVKVVPRAFVRSAVVGNGETQTLYVTVQDQNHEPIPDVQVSASVLLPNSTEVSYYLPATNAMGITQQSFTIRSGDQTGMAIIIVNIKTQKESQTFRTTFRIWY